MLSGLYNSFVCCFYCNCISDILLVIHLDMYCYYSTCVFSMPFSCIINTFFAQFKHSFVVLSQSSLSFFALHDLYRTFVHSLFMCLYKGNVSPEK